MTSPIPTGGMYLIEGRKEGSTNDTIINAARVNNNIARVSTKKSGKLLNRLVGIYQLTEACQSSKYGALGRC
jgi:hypothetical protein